MSMFAAMQGHSTMNGGVDGSCSHRWVVRYSTRDLPDPRSSRVWRARCERCSFSLSFSAVVPFQKRARSPSRITRIALGLPHTWQSCSAWSLPDHIVSMLCLAANTDLFCNRSSTRPRQACFDQQYLLTILRGKGRVAAIQHSHSNNARNSHELPAWSGSCYGRVGKGGKGGVCEADSNFICC